MTADEDRQQEQLEPEGVKVKCECGKRLRVPRRGVKFKCPKCSAVVLVPTARETRARAERGEELAGGRQASAWEAKGDEDEDEDEDELDDLPDCPKCGSPLVQELFTGVFVCSECFAQFTADVEDEPDGLPALRQTGLPVHETSVPLQQKPQRRWLKNLGAVIIGMVGGKVVGIAIGLPLFLLVWTNEDLPDDLSLLLELSAAFVSGAIAGSLVPSWGWLFGMLTQAFKLALVALFLGLWVYVVTTAPDVDFRLLDALRSSKLRVVLMSIVCAAIAGGVAERHREKILGFLRTIFGTIAGAFGCLVYGAFGLFQIYFVYLGGKAIFADGKVLKGLFIICAVGPVASWAAGFIFTGIWMGVFKVFEKVFNTYAEDLLPARTSLYPED